MKISFWAKENKSRARIGIIACFLLINLLAFFTGSLIAEMDMEISEWVFYASVITFCCIYLIYPYRENRIGGKTWRSLFLRRKIFDFLAALTGYLIILQTANHYSLHPQNPLPSFGSTVALGAFPSRSEDISKDNTKPFYRNYTHWLKTKWKSVGRKKAQLKASIALLKKKDDNKESSKALLTILTILGAIGLLFLVVLLSCEISCSGAETLGLIVLIGGSFMVVFAAILIIVRIYGKRIRKRKSSDAVSLASK